MLATGSLSRLPWRHTVDHTGLWCHTLGSQCTESLWAVMSEPGLSAHWFTQAVTSCSGRLPRGVTWGGDVMYSAPCTHTESCRAMSLLKLLTSALFAQFWDWDSSVGLPLLKPKQPPNSLKLLFYHMVLLIYGFAKPGPKWNIKWLADAFENIIFLGNII